MTPTVLHFAEDGDTSGFFPQLARWHDPGRYRMHFGTVKPIDPTLAAYMTDRGIAWFSGEAHDRVGYPIVALRLAAYLRRNRIDVFHAHLFDPSVVGLPTSVAARTPLRVLTRHYSDYHTRIHKRWHVALDRMCTRLSHGVIAVSHHTRNHMVDVERAAPDKVRVVHNGIDFDRVRLSAPDSARRIREEFHAHDKTLLVVPARLHPEKGHPVLFTALAAARARTRRPMVVLIAGRGTFETEYRHQVRSLGLEDVVQFLGFRRDVCDLMAAADLVVVPSVAEAFGLVLAEALYLGTPVLASRVGGIPEVVEDGVDGVLFPPGDAQALQEALISLLDNDERRRSLAGRGAQRVVRQFSFESMVRAYEAFYDDLREVHAVVAGAAR